jgi:hypothetical protein
MVNHALVVALVAITGCQSMAEFATTTDTGPPDARTPDARTPDASTPDAGTPDASTPDGEVLACLGTQLLTICITPSALTSVTISAPLIIDTDKMDMCTAIGKYCVIAATTLTINAALRATGTKPLVLLASDSIIVNQLIDVGSHRVPAEFIGAGADPVFCPVGALPGTSAGGAGGSFAGTGGSGGAGGDGGSGGLPASATTPITAFRGGCRGQDGNGPGKGVGGHGGGAVYLIAGNRISITGPGINAAGEGGTGGAVIANVSGGGGGGVGGMIGLDAPTITCTGLILANGGGGGQGSGTINPGANGLDPAGINAASGGTSALGGSGCGGNGGNGSSGIVGGSGASGGAFQCGAPGGGGGGGGGGGAGIVKAPATADLGTQLSPMATP